jgi:hypothetical protein
MKTWVSIAELLNAGVRLEPFEAVAVAQQLIAAYRHSATGPAAGVEPPYGPPTPATVLLTAEGSVRCNGCETTPAVSEVAIFLDALLPAGSLRVPGALRYTIARGMLDIDVAPFDSLEEFSAALVRHEQGARDMVVRGLLVRAGHTSVALMRPVTIERRRDRAVTTNLRRALREADARLYEQQMKTRARDTRRSTARPQTWSAVAAGLGAGVLLMGAGERLQTHRLFEAATTPEVAPAIVATAAPAPAIPITAVDPLLLSDVDGVAPAVAVRPRPVRVAGAAPRVIRVRASVLSRASMTRPPRAAAANRSGARRDAPGMLDRLRLGWLRDGF